CVFFFSSRRRHTRSKRDWSSDVCSSDLAATADLKDVNKVDNFHLEAYGQMAVNYNRDIDVFPVVRSILTKISDSELVYRSPTDRSEERRVGKERRSGWSSVVCERKALWE